MSAAGALRAVMLRMDILTGESFSKRYDEALSASVAGMHAETYDTYQIPYDQQSCKHLCNQTLHHNLQRYKIVPKTQIGK